MLVDRFPLPASSRVTVPRTGRRAFGAPRRGHTHAGVDLFASAGTTIVSPVDGTVFRTLDDAERDCGFGVIIDSSDGYRWTLCHFGAVPVVERGEHVEAGDALGVVGNTGNARNTGAHLHIHATDHGEPADVTGALADALERERGASPASSVPGRRRASDSRRVSRASRSGAGIALLLAAGAYFVSRNRRRNGR